MALDQVLDALDAGSPAAPLDLPSTLFEEARRRGAAKPQHGQLGEPTRGVPTAYAAPPLLGKFAGPAEPPPVWPDPDGSVRGQSFAPLYKLAPAAAENDGALYELLVLVDAIRSGRAREREFAVKELKRRLRADG